MRPSVSTLVYTLWPMETGFVCPFGRRSTILLRAGWPACVTARTSVKLHREGLHGIQFCNESPWASLKYFWHSAWGSCANHTYHLENTLHANYNYSPAWKVLMLGDGKGGALSQATLMGGDSDYLSNRPYCLLLIWKKVEILHGEFSSLYS